MTGGEIELRNRSHPECAYLVELRLKEILIPRVGRGDLGVSVILDGVSDVDKQSVVLMLTEETNGSIPGGYIYVIVIVVKGRDIRAYGLGNLIAPHMRGEVYEIGPHQLFFHFILQKINSIV